MIEAIVRMTLVITIIKESLLYLIIFLVLFIFFIKLDFVFLFIQYTYNIINLSILAISLYHLFIFNHYLK